MSMGFAVPASIGVALAAKKLRPYVVVGDGAFQMTGTEVSTAVRLGLNPIIFVLNNDGYGTMRRIHEGSFNVITQWDYRKICELVGGGTAVCANTKGELDEAIRCAQDSGELTVIEVKLPRDDISPQLARIGLEVAKLRGWKVPARAANDGSGALASTGESGEAAVSATGSRTAGINRQRADLNPSDHSCK